MKKTHSRIKHLRQRAADVRQTVESMPARAAALREQVAATVEQAQQIRTDVAAGLSGLAAMPPALPGSAGAGSRASDVALAATIGELEALAPTLAEAGFSLYGVDLELGASLGGLGGARRLRVRLEWVSDVGLSSLRRLHDAQRQPTARKLFAAMVQAREIAETMSVRELVLVDLAVDVDSGQALRLGWRAEDAPAPASSVSASVNPPASLTPVTLSASPGYFARPALTTAGTPASTGGPVSPLPATTALAPTKTYSGTRSITLTTASSPLAANWRASALDRFKKMPDLTKPASLAPPSPTQPLD